MYWTSVYTDQKLLQSLIQMSGRLQELENKVVAVAYESF